RQAFTLGANQSATLTLSAPERALADARALSPNMLEGIRNPNDLGPLENRDSVRGLVPTLPQAEQGAIARASGDLASAGLARGTSLESAMAQRDAFGAQSLESERLMRMFYDADGKSAASSGQTAGGLRHYAQEALKVDAAPGLGLGLPAVAAKDILDVSVQRA